MYNDITARVIYPTDLWGNGVVFHFYFCCFSYCGFRGDADGPGGEWASHQNLPLAPHGEVLGGVNCSTCSYHIKLLQVTTHAGRRNDTWQICSLSRRASWHPLLLFFFFFFFFKTLSFSSQDLSWAGLFMLYVGTEAEERETVFLTVRIWDWSTIQEIYSHQGNKHFSHEDLLSELSGFSYKIIW